MLCAVCYVLYIHALFWVLFLHAACHVPCYQAQLQNPRTQTLDHQGSILALFPAELLSTPFASFCQTSLGCTGLGGCRIGSPGCLVLCSDPHHSTPPFCWRGKQEAAGSIYSNTLHAFSAQNWNASRWRCPGQSQGICGHGGGKVTNPRLVYL